VADANSRTVVVVHSVGQVDMEWSNHPNISAIVWAGLPGQESGNSLADVLFGDVNPSGRLPYTIANAESDYHSRIEKNKDIHYTEDLKLGYRWFESQVNMNDVLDSYDMIVSIELTPSIPFRKFNLNMSLDLVCLTHGSITPISV
jgi:hypothetical protein